MMKSKHDQEEKKWNKTTDGSQMRETIWLKTSGRGIFQQFLCLFFSFIVHYTIAIESDSALDQLAEAHNFSADYLKF